MKRAADLRESCSSGRQTWGARLIAHTVPGSHSGRTWFAAQDDMQPGMARRGRPRHPVKLRRGRPPSKPGRFLSCKHCPFSCFLSRRLQVYIVPILDITTGMRRLRPGPGGYLVLSCYCLGVHRSPARYERAELGLGVAKYRRSVMASRGSLGMTACPKAHGTRENRARRGTDAAYPTCMDLPHESLFT